MSHRILLKKKFSKPDLKYNNILISLFINKILKNGKSYLAKRIAYKTLTIIKLKTNKNPILMFEKAIKIIKPSLELTSKNIGKIICKVPTFINTFKAINISLRWLLYFSKKRSEKGISNKIAMELYDILNLTGNTLKKKEETYKIAKANKIFTEFN